MNLYRNEKERKRVHEKSLLIKLPNPDSKLLFLDNYKLEVSA